MEFENNIQYDTYSVDGDIFGLQYFNQTQFQEQPNNQFNFTETTTTTNNFNDTNQQSIQDLLKSIWSRVPWDTILLIYWIISGIIILFLLFVFIYYQIRLTKVRKDVDEKLQSEIEAQLSKHSQEPIGVNQRWATVKKLISSPNESDWRLAIIEADTVLESLLIQLGYEGKSLGERLSSVQKRHFPKLEQAWTAHLVRNRIAHEASLYKLDKADAVRTISLYEEVLRDANFIA